MIFWIGYKIFVLLFLIFFHYKVRAYLFRRRPYIYKKGVGLLLWLAELCEDTSSRLRMEESDSHLLSACSWSLVDETNALTFCFNESLCYAVFYRECYMVNALATLFEPLSYSAFRACRLKEFELCLTYLKEGSLYFLVSNLFDSVALET